MKKKGIILAMAMLCTALLSACGSAKGNISYLSENMNAVDSVGGYYASKAATGGDYSSTYISGDLADYNYTFRAAGDTYKSKEDMLSYFEDIQKFVDDNDGYISSVNNCYDAHTVMSDSYISDSTIKYEATGSLDFVVEIDNEKISLVTDKLEQFCKDNNFKVTSYYQRITNYKEYTVVEGYDDQYRDDVITREELDKRLRYATLYVTVNYNIPRPAIMQFVYGFQKIWDGIVDGFGDVIKAFLFIALGLVILFAEAILFYKVWRKMLFKHRMKKPEYYPPKHVIVEEKKE